MGCRDVEISATVREISAVMTTLNFLFGIMLVRNC